MASAIQSKQSPGERRRNVISAAVVCIFTFAAYFPAIRADFIWNDSDYVTAPALQSLGGLRRIWFDLGATEQYYPVLHSAFWIEHRLWGDAPAGYHLANILLHAANACLFALVLARLAGRANRPGEPRLGGDASPYRPAAWLAGLIFALHPICVESVAWISEQKNTLSTFFYLLAAWTYLRYDEDRRRSGIGGFVADGARSAKMASERESRRDASDGRPSGQSEAQRASVSFPSSGAYLLASLFFILAVLSKTVTATLPAALLVVLWWRRERWDWRLELKPLVPWLIFGIGAGLFSAWVERTYIGARGAAFDLSLIQRLLLAGNALWFYLAKLFWPAHLIFIYPRWSIRSWDWREYLPLIAVGAVLAAAWARNRPAGRSSDRPGALAALLFFGGTLFPVLGFFNVYAFMFSFVADHFQYLACLGVIAFTAEGLDWGGRRPVAEAARLSHIASGLRAKRLRVVPPAAQLGTRRRHPFGTRIRSPSPRFALRPLLFLLLAVLGLLTHRQCRLYRDIETFYRVTLDRNPDAWMAQNNLGDALYGRGDYPGAIGRFRQVVRLKPDFAEAHYNLANSLYASGRVEQSVVEYAIAARLQPDALRVRNDYAAALMAAGHPGDAIAQLQAAVGLAPGVAETHYNLAKAFGQAGRYGDAIRSLEKALRLRPHYPEAENNLGAALAEAGRWDEAIVHYRRAIRLNPTYPLAHRNLAVALEHVGDWKAAREEMERAGP